MVTVLFADLAGFTAQSEAMDPEDVAALLDPYHARLKAELERFGGTVEKFIGDAVMAVFGAPVAHEDDAERAVRAALAIRDWADDEGIELRVGINTGEALVTLGARPEEGQAMAAGDVVNTAARLQSAAPVGGILVGEQTVAATGAAIEFAAETAVAAKRQGPAGAGACGGTGTRPAARGARPRRRARRPRSRGRAALGSVRPRPAGAGARARDGGRRSRNRQEPARARAVRAGRAATPSSISWRHGRCLAYGEGITFWALAEMVKAEAGILEGDDAAETERKLHAVVDDPWVESHLRPLVGLPGAADGGGDRRDEAFTAWRRFFERLADERPLVLVFEDLHWADDDLLDFVDHLTDWASGVPLLVICTARPELLARRPGWGGGKPNSLTISLSPLSDGDTSRLLGRLVERSVLPAGTQAELLLHAGGNPLYAEEFARMLLERGQIERLPETVQGLIAARLDLLEPAEKQLVQDAAVVGKVVLAEPARAARRRRVGRAREDAAYARAEGVRPARAFLVSVAGDSEYSFRHVLVRDVAYGQIPRADRSDKHIRTAHWIESLGRAEDHSEMLAYHYLQALEIGAATGADVQAFAAAAQVTLSDAGDRAAALHAYAAAGRYYRAALGLLPEGDIRRSRLLLKLGYGEWLIGEPPTEHLREAAVGMLAAGDLEGAAEAETRLAESAWLAGERDASFEHLRRARELLDPLPASRTKAHTIAMAARLKMLASDDREAIRVGLEALAMADDLGLDDVRATALDTVGTARGSLGEPGWMDDLEEAARVAVIANTPFEVCRSKGNLAAQLWVRGRIAEAIGQWEETATAAARYGQVAFERWVEAVLIVPRYTTGRWDEASTSADAFIADIEAGRPHYLASQAYSCRALLRHARDETAGALADAESALEAATRAADNQALLPTLSRFALIQHELGDDERAGWAVSRFLAELNGEHIGYRIGSTHELSWTAVALGRGAELAEAVAGHSGSWPEAALAYTRGDPTRAADISAASGAVSEEAYARLAAARLLAGKGRRAEADEQLVQALAFYRSVGATRYVREGEALLTGGR